MNTRSFGWRVMIVLVLPLVGCGDDATGPEALCIAVVNVDGVLFGELGGEPVAAASVSSAPVLTVTRNTGCLDQGEPADPLGSGESNFLDAGTPIHSIDGFAPTERLAVYYDLIEEWRAIGPLDGGNDPG